MMVSEDESCLSINIGCNIRVITSPNRPLDHIVRTDRGQQLSGHTVVNRCQGRQRSKVVRAHSCQGGRQWSIIVRADRGQ